MLLTVDEVIEYLTLSFQLQPGQDHTLFLQDVTALCINNKVNLERFEKCVLFWDSLKFIFNEYTATKISENDDGGNGSNCDTHSVTISLLECIRYLSRFSSLKQSENVNNIKLLGTYICTYFTYPGCLISNELCMYLLILLLHCVR